MRSSAQITNLKLNPTCAITAEEIRTGMTAEFAADARQALAGCRYELSGAGGEKELREKLVVAIGNFLRTGGGNMTKEDRNAFVRGCVEVLADDPFDLVMAAIMEAPRKVRWSNEFLPWIIDRIEAKATKLREECTVLERLVELTQG